MKIKLLFAVMAIVLMSGCNVRDKEENNNKPDINITAETEEVNNADSNYYATISDYLKKEAETALSPYYELLDFKISNYDENIVGDDTEVLLNFTIVHKNFDKDPDTVDYIKTAKENNNPNYETLYKEYLEPKEMNMEIKAVINKDGEITLYSDVDSHEGREWVEFKMSDCIISSDDTNKEEKSMAKLLYQGHGSFKITMNGKVIYVDPYAGEGYDDPADLILVTHQHPDHNKIDLPPHADDCVIFQNTDAIKDGVYQSADIAGVHIEALEAYNQNHNKSECVGYLVTVNDKVLYFAGDTSKTEQMKELADKHIDYAFLPIDGRFNMDIPEAVECAELIQAKHTVPVHMSPGKLFDRERAERFVTSNALIIEANSEIEL